MSDSSERQELFAERLRLDAMRLSSPQMSKEVPTAARVKLYALWVDVTYPIRMASRGAKLTLMVEGRIARSLGVPDCGPSTIKLEEQCPSPVVLSLVEAEYDVLREVGKSGKLQREFRSEVNRILEAHAVAFRLTEKGQIIPVDSFELHNAVVSPAMHLLHSSQNFATTETAYQNALDEIRRDDPADAVTDAATALQEMFTACGFPGPTLGKQISSARAAGLFGGVDNPLLDALTRVSDWVAAKRNNGEAHKGDPGFTRDDAWLIVHVAGAVIVYLASRVA
ncbi:hypothetical protein SEA_MARTEENA_41 [Gordonia phage Marteena]|nr:membrane protein [Gordonia phage EMsquaredA]QDP45126.1 hypothetical protein SEA_MARTEENA_41 [Gordonia phage Marteena]